MTDFCIDSEMRYSVRIKRLLLTKRSEGLFEMDQQRNRGRSICRFSSIWALHKVTICQLCSTGFTPRTRQKSRFSHIFPLCRQEVYLHNNYKICKLQSRFGIKIYWICNKLPSKLKNAGDILGLSNTFTHTFMIQSRIWHSIHNRYDGNQPPVNLSLHILCIFQKRILKLDMLNWHYDSKRNFFEKSAQN